MGKDLLVCALLVLPTTGGKEVGAPRMGACSAWKQPLVAPCGYDRPGCAPQSWLVYNGAWQRGACILGGGLGGLNECQGRR